MSVQPLSGYRFGCTEKCSATIDVASAASPAEAAAKASQEGWVINPQGASPGAMDNEAARKLWHNVVTGADLEVKCPSHAGNPAGDDVVSEAADAGWQQFV